MSVVADFARLAEAYCNREGLCLDRDRFTALTPTCSLVERERILAELPTWARRQIEGRTR
jgi:hypothetical protein